jgi:hypothetical protein
MTDTTFDKVKKTAGDVVHALGEVVQTASERIADIQEVQKLTAQIRTLNRERATCGATIVNLVVRMFDQGAFAETLLRPEYQRIKEIDAEVTRLEAEKAAIGTVAVPAAPGDAAMPEPDPEITAADDEPQG